MLRVLIVEDEEYRRMWFRKYLCAYIDFTKDVDDAIQLLATNVYNVLFLDHDLGTEPKVGRDVAKWLIANPDVLPELHVVVHSINTVSGPKMTRELQEAGRRVDYKPFHVLIAESAQ